MKSSIQIASRAFDPLFHPIIPDHQDLLTEIGLPDANLDLWLKVGTFNAVHDGQYNDRRVVLRENPFFVKGRKLGLSEDELWELWIEDCEYRVKEREGEPRDCPFCGGCNQDCPDYQALKMDARKTEFLGDMDGDITFIDPFAL